MQQLPGQTRTSIKENHALIAPDGHVPITLPGWEKTQGIILISPHMRGLPRFTQYIALMEEGGKSNLPLSGMQRFVYVLEGAIAVKRLNEEAFDLAEGHFAYFPADTEYDFVALSEAKLLIFEKPYTASTVFLDGDVEFHTGDAWAGEGEPFLEDEDTQLRILLPTDTAYDMAVNLFTFQPGAVLPFVETHIMEHGLYLLEGQGIYRLDDSYYPVAAGDSIWMGSYCPQWFCAYGKTQSTYIYYKDVNRDPLA